VSDLAIDGGKPQRTEPFPPRRPFGQEEVDLATQAIRSQSLFGMGGKMLGELERRFAELYGAKRAVTSTSGTAAIHVAVAGVDPEPGDEFITCPITDAGTIVGMLYQNAIPIFADIDDTYNMDPSDVEAKITPRTKAILLVHLFGNPCDMDRMLDIARRHKLDIIEDCAQTHMTEYKGRFVGTFGRIGCFSLQQSKHMTCGDGGVTITSDEALGQRMSMFRDKGWARDPSAGARGYHFLGLNYRMTELHAAVALAQMDKVADVVRKRNELGDLLSESIRGVPGVVPAPVTSGGKHTYWLYPLRVTGLPAERFAEALGAEGVPCWVGYTGDPIYLCMQALAGKATFGRSGHPLDGCHGGRKIEYTRGMCPRAEKLLSELVILTIHEGLARDDVLDMAAAVRKVGEALSARA
jgi:perosamine synthetase